MLALMPEDRMQAENIGVELFRTFLAVSELRSHKRAAAHLHLSPPAVSGHLRRLQDQLGVKLFDTSVPGVRLSTEGAIVVETAKDIVNSHDRLIEQIQQSRSATPDRTTIRIGIPHELRCWLLVPLLAEVQKSHPELEFQLRRGSSTSLLNELKHGDLDICPAVTATPPPTTVRTYQEDVVWVSRPDEEHTLGNPVLIVAHPDGSIVRNLMLSSLEDANIKYRVTFQAAHIDGTIAAVRRGLGCMALLRSNAASDLFQRNDLPPIPHAYWGIHLRQTLPVIERLADDILTILP